MSLETWKNEFYPEDATEPHGALAAVEHSLRKWKGLRAVELEKHKLTRSYSQLRDSEGQDFYISSDTCALCVQFYDIESPQEDHLCSKCPLYIIRGDYPCDDCKTGSEKQSPYFAFTRDGSGNPEPMIAALEQAREYVKAQGYSPLA